MRGEEGGRRDTGWTTVQSRLSAPGHKGERLTPLLRRNVDFCLFKSSSWVTGVGLCLCKPHFYNLLSVKACFPPVLTSKCAKLGQLILTQIKVGSEGIIIIIII